MTDIQISIIKEQDYLDSEDVENIEVFSSLLCKELEISDKMISIVLAGSTIVTELNEKYRNINDTTDVLSFPLNSIESEDPILGEIIIDIDKAYQQSMEYGHTLIKELSFLILHGTLHLIGYDHDKEHRGEMRLKEKELAIKMGLIC